MLIRENVPEARHLSPRLKLKLFAIRMALTLPLLAAAFLFAYVFLPPAGIQPGVQFDVVFWLSAIAVVAGQYALISLRFRKFVFALREKDIIIQKGIIEKLRYVVPYEKVQNVTVNRDFLDVALGIGTVHIETAAHMVLENDIQLPGIPNDSDLVNEIVERSKIAKSGAGQEGKAADELNVLKEILSEVQAMRKELARPAREPEEKEAPSPITHREAAAKQISEDLKKSKVLFDKSGRRK